MKKNNKILIIIGVIVLLSFGLFLTIKLIIGDKPVDLNDNGNNEIEENEPENLDDPDDNVDALDKPKNEGTDIVYDDEGDAVLDGLDNLPEYELTESNLEGIEKSSEGSLSFGEKKELSNILNGKDFIVLRDVNDEGELLTFSSHYKEVFVYNANTDNSNKIFEFSDVHTFDAQTGEIYYASNFADTSKPGSIYYHDKYDFTDKELATLVDGDIVENIVVFEGVVFYTVYNNIDDKTITKVANSVTDHNEGLKRELETFLSKNNISSVSADKETLLFASSDEGVVYNATSGKPKVIANFGKDKTETLLLLDNYKENFVVYHFNEKDLEESVFLNRPEIKLGDFGSGFEVNFINENFLVFSEQMNHYFHGIYDIRKNEALTFTKSANFIVVNDSHIFYKDGSDDKFYSLEYFVE